MFGSSGTSSQWPDEVALLNLKKPTTLGLWTWEAQLLQRRSDAVLMRRLDDWHAPILQLPAIAGARWADVAESACLRSSGVLWRTALRWLSGETGNRGFVGSWASWGDGHGSRTAGKGSFVVSNAGT
jgi:hypothetical protein